MLLACGGGRLGLIVLDSLWSQSGFGDVSARAGRGLPPDLAYQQ